MKGSRSGSRWWRIRRQSSHPSTETLKIHLQVEQFKENSYGVLTEDLRCLKRHKNLHITGLDKRKKEKEGIRMAPAPRGGSCEGRKFPAHWEGTSPVEKLDSTVEEFGSLRGESSNLFLEVKAESNLHRGSALTPCATQTETLLCW